MSVGTVDLHRKAAQHHRSAADFHELAAQAYADENHERAAHYALLAGAHMEHARGFMADAAKLHVERHGGNKHTVTGH